MPVGYDGGDWGVCKGPMNLLLPSARAEIYTQRGLPSRGSLSLKSTRSPNCDHKLDRTAIGADELNANNHDRVIDNEHRMSESIGAVACNTGPSM